MSDELTGRSNSLVAELLSVVLDVDDDDRDIIRVIIGITNESSVPISNIESSIDTIGKGSYSSERSVSSIGPGLTRNFHFTLQEDPGHWVFNLSHGSGDSKEALEIGPIRADLRLGETLEEEVELAGTSIGGGIGGGLIADVFSDALGDFGKVRETIEIQMEFEGTPEKSSRDAENEDEMEQDSIPKPPKPLKPPSKPVSKSWDEIPVKPSPTPPPKPSMTPPPKPPMDSPSANNASDPLLSSDVLAKISSNSSSGMTSKSEENARPPPPTQGNKVREAPPTSDARTADPITAHSEASPSVREAPPSGPPASTPPSGPPSGPPASVPPSGPPSGPPSNAPPKSVFKPPSSGPPK